MSWRLRRLLADEPTLETNTGMKRADEKEENDITSLESRRVKSSPAMKRADEKQKDKNRYETLDKKNYWKKNTVLKTQMEPNYHLFQ